MDRDEIEVLEDFDFDGDEVDTNTHINTESNASDVTYNNIDNKIDKIDSSEEVSVATNATDSTNNLVEEQIVEATNIESSQEEKEQLENPVVEMINNKTTMKLIAIMLIVLFVAVFLMPKFFELIGNI